VDSKGTTRRFQTRDGMIMHPYAASWKINCKGERHKAQRPVRRFAVQKPDPRAGEDPIKFALMTYIRKKSQRLKERWK